MAFSTSMLTLMSINKITYRPGAMEYLIHEKIEVDVFVRRHSLGCFSSNAGSPRELEK